MSTTENLSAVSSASMGVWSVINKGSVVVQVNPDVELMQIVMYLTGLEHLTAQATNQSWYVDQISSWFRSSSSHEAVTHTARLVHDGFVHGKPLRVALLMRGGSLDDFFDSPFEVRQTSEDIRTLVQLLATFSDDSRFVRFLESMQGFYADAEQHISQAVDESVISDMETYFGDRLGGYNIIGCPLYGHHGLQLRVPRPRTAYFICCQPLMDQRTSRYTWFSERDLAQAICHEFGHCFINHVTYGYIDALSQMNNLRSVHGHMPRAYNNWATVINEYLVRAFTLRYIGSHYGKAMDGSDCQWTKSEIERHENVGFILMRVFVSLLDEYEVHKREYRTFSEFYPEIINRLAREDASLESGRDVSRHD